VVEEVRRLLLGSAIEVVSKGKMDRKEPTQVAKNMQMQQQEH
jgi:hypothetical protein